MGVNMDSSKKVREYIFSELEDSNLKIGDRLPTEIQLATHLNVSRSSVREALQSLKSIGLLNSSQGSGYTIIGNATATFSEALRVIMATTPIQFTDISEIREALEMKAVQLAIRNHITTDSLRHLYDCVEHMKLADTSNIAQKYDIDFHQKIAKLSGNPFLINFIEALSQFSDRYILISWNDITSRQKENLITSHNNIIQYLQEGKTDEAQKGIVNHYKLADSIIQSTTNHSTRQSIEKILSKLYSEGFNDEQILSRLSSLSQ